MHWEPRLLSHVAELGKRRPGLAGPGTGVDGEDPSSARPQVRSAQRGPCLLRVRHCGGQMAASSLCPRFNSASCSLPFHVASLPLVLKMEAFYSGPRFSFLLNFALPFKAEGPRC